MPKYPSQGSLKALKQLPCHVLSRAFLVCLLTCFVLCDICDDNPSFHLSVQQHSMSAIFFCSSSVLFIILCIFVFLRSFSVLLSSFDLLFLNFFPLFCLFFVNRAVREENLRLSAVRRSINMSSYSPT